MCNHNNRTLVKLKYGSSVCKTEVDDEVIIQSFSDVDLWHCNDCKRDLIYDYHIGKYQPLKIIKEDGYHIHKVK